MAAETEDEDGYQGSLTEDHIFGLLSSERRRYVIRILDEVGIVNRHNLVDLVASEEFGKETDDLTDEERTRLQASLKQSHLTELQEKRVILWDDPYVGQGPNFETILWYLVNGPGKQ